MGDGLGRDLRLGMLSWSSWGFCLPRALLEGTGASRFSVFTGVITHTHIDGLGIEERVGMYAPLWLRVESPGLLEKL